MAAQIYPASNLALTEPPGKEDPALRTSGPPEHGKKTPRRPAITTDGRVKVLVADDERLSREHLSRALAGWGYDVVTTGEGGKALGLLLSADAPRLALLDWEMPGLSGIEVCRLLRGRADAPYVYVVLCTGREGQRHLIDGLAAGADDYVRKPFDPQELEVRVRAGRRVVLLQDQLLEAQSELERRALHDSLTGTKNRGAIADVLARELSRSRRTRRPISVVICDVDHFKKVNDTHGHPAGDAVLREFVLRAKNEVRSHDDVGRWGGEEFLVVLPECPTDEATRVAERLRLALASEPIVVGDERITVTASFGVAGTDQGHGDLNTIVSAADEALYAAKASGRNRVKTAGVD
ncbi:MAG TPA: diguanylate cyclase [Polyangiaceae bacterium]|jgi:diguanylate cyclase (GGDEF)-like protein|nr:diguanylate cyclase [Polyangiaceae bacterium]